MTITVELTEEEREEHGINLAWVEAIQIKLAEQLQAEADDLLYEIAEEYKD